MINKRIIIIGAVILALLIVASFFVTTYVIKKDNLQILVSPRDAKVTLNGKEYPANKPFYITPGDYTLSLSAENFTPTSEKITVTDTYAGLSYCLTPTNMESDEYLSEHPDDRFICEGAAGQAYNKEVSTAIKEYPVIGQLPYEDGTFSVGQGLVEGTGELALYVHYSSQKSKEEALEWIRRYSPDKLPVLIYTDDYEQTGKLGGAGSEFDQRLTAKNPITKTLPTDAYIYKLGYRIDQSDKSGQSIKLTIKSDTASGRIAALREIKALGYDPTDYKIEFLNFENEVTRK